MESPLVGPGSPPAPSSDLGGLVQLVSRGFASSSPHHQTRHDIIAFVLASAMAHPHFIATLVEASTLAIERSARWNQSPEVRRLVAAGPNDELMANVPLGEAILLADSPELMRAYHFLSLLLPQIPLHEEAPAAADEGEHHQTSTRMEFQILTDTLSHPTQTPLQQTSDCQSMPFFPPSPLQPQQLLLPLSHLLPVAAHVLISRPITDPQPSPQRTSVVIPMPAPTSAADNLHLQPPAAVSQTVPASAAAPSSSIFCPSVAPSVGTATPQRRRGYVPLVMSSLEVHCQIDMNGRDDGLTTEKPSQPEQQQPAEAVGLKSPKIAPSSSPNRRTDDDCVIVQQYDSSKVVFCEQCNKSFPRTTFNEHVAQASILHQASYRCPHAGCGEWFGRRTAVILHQAGCAHGLSPLKRVAARPSPPASSTKKRKAASELTLIKDTEPESAEAAQSARLKMPRRGSGAGFKSAGDQRNFASGGGSRSGFVPPAPAASSSSRKSSSNKSAAAAAASSLTVPASSLQHTTEPHSSTGSPSRSPVTPRQAPLEVQPFYSDTAQLWLKNQELQKHIDRIQTVIYSPGYSRLHTSLLNEMEPYLMGLLTEVRREKLRREGCLGVACQSKSSAPSARATVCLPCSHVSLCAECVQVTSHCPVCREPILQFMKLNLSLPPPEQLGSPFPVASPPSEPIAAAAATSSPRDRLRVSLNFEPSQRRAESKKATRETIEVHSDGEDERSASAPALQLRTDFFSAIRRGPAVYAMSSAAATSPPPARRRRVRSAGGSDPAAAAAPAASPVASSFTHQVRADLRAAATGGQAGERSPGRARASVLAPQTTSAAASEQYLALTLSPVSLSSFPLASTSSSPLPAAFVLPPAAAAISAIAIDAQSVTAAARAAANAVVARLQQRAT